MRVSPCYPLRYMCIPSQSDSDVLSLTSVLPYVHCN